MTPEEIAALVDKMVDRKLAALGGQLLALHGPEGAHPNPQLATIGGFLLQAYGRPSLPFHRDVP